MTTPSSPARTFTRNTLPEAWVRSLRSVVARVFALLLLMAVAVSGQEAGTRSTHKVRVSDPKEAGRIIAAGGRLVADYVAFQILQIPAAGPALAAVGGNGHWNLRGL